MIYIRKIPGSECERSHLMSQGRYPEYLKSFFPEPVLNFLGGPTHFAGLTTLTDEQVIAMVNFLETIGIEYILEGEE